MAADPTDIRRANAGAATDDFGTDIVPGAAGATFGNLQLEVTAVADALVDPTDLPDIDTTRLVEDGTGARALWTYRASSQVWKGVQLS